MTEIYKTITDFPDYEVSNFGNVLSHKRKTPRVLKPAKGKQKYFTVELSVRGQKKKKCYIHRLVATAFHENPDNLPEVNHKDENRLNNRADNLEWCTQEYNLKYGSTHPSKKVHCITNNTIYDSINKAARELNIQSGNISAQLSGQRKTAGGYQFEFVEVNDERLS